MDMERNNAQSGQWRLETHGPRPSAHPVQVALEVAEIPRVNCDGWLEPTHATRGPVVMMVDREDARLTLCMCCATDFLNDIMTSDEDKYVCQVALDVARTLRSSCIA